MEVNSGHVNADKCLNRLLMADFNLKYNFPKYLSLVKSDFNIVKEYFPLLNLTILPTNRAKEIFITGKLIPYEILQECSSQNDIDMNSIYILAIYPSDFNDSDIYVQDLYDKIDWSKIPYEHWHIRPNKGREIICTHHLDGEINDIAKAERSIAILFSAWKLYIQCKEFPVTKKWILKDLKHGNDAIRQLRLMGKYYGK